MYICPDCLHQKVEPITYKLGNYPSSCPEGMMMSDKKQNKEADVQKVVYPRSQKSCRDGKGTQTFNTSGTIHQTLLALRPRQTAA